MFFRQFTARAIIVGACLLLSVPASAQTTGGVGVPVPFDKAREQYNLDYSMWRQLDAELANLPKDKAQALGKIDQAAAARDKVQQARQQYVRALAARATTDANGVAKPAVRLSSQDIRNQYDDDVSELSKEKDRYEAELSSISGETGPAASIHKGNLKLSIQKISDLQTRLVNDKEHLKAADTSADDIEVSMKKLKDYQDSLITVLNASTESTDANSKSWKGYYAARRKVVEAGTDVVISAGGVLPANPVGGQATGKPAGTASVESATIGAPAQGTGAGIVPGPGVTPVGTANGPIVRPVPAGGDLNAARNKMAGAWAYTEHSPPDKMPYAKNVELKITPAANGELAGTLAVDLDQKGKHFLLGEAKYTKIACDFSGNGVQENGRLVFRTNGASTDCTIELELRPDSLYVTWSVVPGATSILPIGGVEVFRKQ